MRISLGAGEPSPAVRDLAARASSRSSDSARCEPRLSSTRAWISSTITVRVVRSIPRPRSLVRRMYRDSGVVTRMCGGRRSIAARSFAGVSPVRTSVRISESRSSPMALSSAAMPASGSCRLRWMSFDSALSGETYTTCVVSSSRPATAWRTRPSMAARNAARVFPEPVGAATSVARPSLMAGQARACGPVGPAGKRRPNQPATAG